jgi:hypothetical protein
MGLMAPDGVHGLCAACVAKVEATNTDAREYLQCHLPRTQLQVPLPPSREQWTR